MSKRHCLILLFTIVLFSSCYNLEDRKKLARAQTLLEQEYADSAANTLDSIYFPEKMGKEYHMQYLVTYVQAKYKAYRDIKNDTAVMEAVRYYEHRKENPERIAMANYSAGVVLIEQGNYEPAMEYLKRAAQVIENKTEYKLLGLIYSNIGYLYDLQLLNDNAIKYYKLAFLVNIKSGLVENQLYNLTTIGNKFLLRNEYDSAMFYFSIAEDIAVKSKNHKLQATILNNKSIVFNELKQYNAALLELKKINDLPLTYSQTNKQYLNLANSYLHLRQQDSAQFYFNKIIGDIKESDDLYFKASLYSYLTELEKEKKNYPKAMEYLEMYNNISMDILKENQSKALIEAEKRFDYTYHKNESERAKLENQQIILLFTFIVLMFIFFSYWWTQRQKQRRIQIENEKIMTEQANSILDKEKKEAERLALEQSLILPLYNQIASRNLTINYFLKDLIEDEVISNTPKLSKKIAKEQKLFNEKLDISDTNFYTEEQFELFTGLSISKCKVLTSKDRILLMLLALKLNDKQLAVLLNMAVDSLRMARFRLNKKLKENNLRPYWLNDRNELRI